MLARCALEDLPAVPTESIVCRSCLIGISRRYAQTIQDTQEHARIRLLSSIEDVAGFIRFLPPLCVLLFRGHWHAILAPDLLFSNPAVSFLGLTLCNLPLLMRASVSAGFVHRSTRILPLRSLFEEMEHATEVEAHLHLTQPRLLWLVWSDEARERCDGDERINGAPEPCVIGRVVLDVFVVGKGGKLGIGDECWMSGLCCGR